jgi:hypothetical protein
MDPTACAAHPDRGFLVTGVQGAGFLQMAIGIYIGRSGIASSYGAASG